MFPDQVISLHQQRLRRAYAKLLADFGYEVHGNLIIQLPIPPFFSQATVWGRCRDIMDAAERLCPTIANAEYTDRLMKLQRFS